MAAIDSLFLLNWDQIYFVSIDFLEFFNHSELTVLTKINCKFFDLLH
jgi:hypothetical protein